LEGSCEARTKDLGGDKVCVPKGGTPEGDDHLSASLLDLEYHTPIGKNGKLVNIREERKEKDVEDCDSGVKGAPLNNSFVGVDPFVEFGKGPLANVESIGGGAKGDPKVHAISGKADACPALGD
jgi:hypothetical protein